MQIKLLSALLVANLLSLLVLVQLLPHPTTVASQQWEYKIESLPDLSWDEGMLKIGNEGWELVFARRANGSDERMSYEMIFKRPNGGRKTASAPHPGCGPRGGSDGLCARA